MTRREPMRVGNVYRLHNGEIGMVINVIAQYRNAFTGEYEKAVELRMQDGGLHSCFAAELYDCEFLGLPKRTFQKRQKDGQWYERFQVDGGPSFSHTSAGHASLSDARRAAWEATYAPKPEPEPQPAPIDHRLTRNARIEAGRAALNAWGQTPEGRTFWNLWAELEKVARPEGDEYFVQATKREVREFLRRSEGWRGFCAAIEEKV